MVDPGERDVLAALEAFFGHRSCTSGPVVRLRSRYAMACVRARCGSYNHPLTGLTASPAGAGIKGPTKRDTPGNKGPTMGWVRSTLRRWRP
jgi:hypothetical protein